jgi:HD-like signal output (HDOD) protein/CheY-like chemotaxis protein
MKRILFVDDEPNILEGLRGVLRKQRRSWEMTFVGSGEEALRALAAAPHDVIVSDMRMPGMDGAALLGRVKSEHPAVVRIVLSGQTDHQVSRRMVHVAHQFMSKPCDGRELQAAVERACALAALLPDAGLRRMVGGIGQLPIDADVHRALLALLDRPTTPAGEVVAVIERDVGLAAKVLQVVSSALFGAHRLADLAGAVTALGLETIRVLAESGEPADATEVAGVSLAGLGDHGRRAGHLARRILGEGPTGGSAFAACLLQHVGLLVMLTRMPDTAARLAETARRSGRPLGEVEREALGVTHAEIGAYLLGIWGLPPPLVEAVAHHHQPGGAGGDLAAVVHLVSTETGPPAHP